MSLLEFDGKAYDFIEQPPEDVAADVVSGRSHEELIGKKLNHYRILSLLGAGGMGEVYLAEDTKLGRKIAIKLMPARFAENAERRQRFEREAKAVSALNHPNIITIYGIEQAENIDFIATEFIDGRTLHERIKEKPVSSQEAIDVAIQVAGALESAHSLGIIHRDIKPANIMLRQDGYVKVLDFGLAKLMMVKGDSGDSRTREQTAQHQIMGTIFYMSPEQALGEKVDTRTDIFSLGVVLYEMLSGVQPFKGASDAAVYNATINKTPPPLSELNVEVPLELSQIVEKAIEKDSANRYQTAAQMRLDLTQLKHDTSFANYVPVSVVKAVRSRSLVTIVALLFLGAAVAVYFAAFRPASKPPSAQNLNFTQFTTSGTAIAPSFSPDGKTVLFTSIESGNWDVYFQRVGGSNPINLTKETAEDDTQAVFSPNGEMIAFRSERQGGGIFLMGATGENVRRVSDSGYYPSFSPDSREIVYCSAPFDDPTNRRVYPSSLWVLNIASGERRELTKVDAVQPNWSPGGDRIAFWGLDAGGSRNIATISATGDEPVAVTDDPALDWNPVWSRDGRSLYFASNRGGSMNFWQVAIDEKTGKAAGNPEPFTVPSAFGQDLSFSQDGKNLAYAQKVSPANLISVDFDPQTETVAPNPTAITQGTRFIRDPFVSPDGEWIAFDAVKDKQADIFVIRRDGTNLRQLTDDISRDRAPRWSADSRKLIFYSDRSGVMEDWSINIDGSGLTQVSFGEGGAVAFWSPEGKRILQNKIGAYPSILDAEKPFNDQTPSRLPIKSDEGNWMMAYDWTPNGEKIAGTRVSPRTEYSGVAVYDLSTQQYRELTATGAWPVWLGDSRRLLFYDKTKIFLLDTATGRTKEIMSIQPSESFLGITVSRDSRSIYYVLEKKESNIWLGSF